MRGLKLFGEYICEFAVITFFLALAAATVVGFVPMFTGTVKYFSLDRDYRRFKDIFTAMGKSAKILLPFTVFILLMTGVPVLNIYFFSTHPQNSNTFVLAVSYIALVVGIMFLISAPVVITNMNVRLGELFYNGVAVLAAGPLNSILCLAAAGGIAVAAAYYPYVVPIALYPFALITAKLMGGSFNKLKAKSLGRSEADVEREQAHGGYTDKTDEVDSI